MLMMIWIVTRDTRSYAREAVKNPAEVSRVGEPNPAADLVDAVISHPQQFPGPRDAVAIQIIPGRDPQFPLEYPTQVILAHADSISDLPAAQGTGKVLLQECDSQIGRASCRE